jgi:CRISPR-associated protein Csm1
MVDETVYKIAISAYLHDIGKFAERALGKSGLDEVGFFPDGNFINSNRDLYQPHYQGRYSHSHAVYTAAFIDHFEKFLPEQFNKGKLGLGDSFMNLSAGHHKPQTPMQWIIAVADWVSSGFDRAEFEDKYNKEIGVRDYKKTRLLTLFEGLKSDGKFLPDSLESYKYRYPLKELSPENILPQCVDTEEQIDSPQACKDYRELFFNFISALEKLSHKDNIPLWFDHFDSLFLIYCSHIPAASVGYDVPDVSLYDHSKTASAIASSLYKYHQESGTLQEDAIKDDSCKKFLLIMGNFYGIQNFIFSEGANTGKASAKLLRGRSFYVSLLTELVADMICRKLQLPATSIILNSAGKFTILAYNNEKAKEVIKKVENQTNRWLIKNFFGQCSIGFSYLEASCDDFVGRRFNDLWESLSRESDKKKYSKFDLREYGGCINTYLDSFDNRVGICPFCNKRPAKKGIKVKDIFCCEICHDQIYIGENIVKGNRIAVVKADFKIEGEQLAEPIFDCYQVSFKVKGELNKLSREGSLLKYWDIAISENGEIAKDVTAKFINGYVPKYTEKELNEDAIDRILAGKHGEKKKEDLFDSMEEGIPKTFSYLAKMALERKEGEEKFTGVEALGILKADIDNLGFLFACGIRKDRLTLSRLATLSRQINNFFTIFLPYQLKTDERFNNIYTLFAGGDDLFLIGPWNKIIEFSMFLNEKFKEYVCNNNEITLSAGIAVNKPATPVITLAESSEEALEKSKNSGKDRITIFGECVEWEKFKELEEIKKMFENWLESEIINSAMLFRLNEFIEMKKKEDSVMADKVVNVEDMECLKWHSRFKYTVVRNTGKNLKGDEKEKAIKEVEKSADYLESYGGGLRIPLWRVIYSRRR